MPKVICPNCKGLMEFDSKTCRSCRDVAGHKHGHCHKGSFSRTYVSWFAMRRRCLTRTSIAYKYYGGRGIRICKRWERFTNFLADMGERPVGKTLDRKNHNRNYSPSNCRWATPLEQSRDCFKPIKNIATGEKFQSIKDAMRKYPNEYSTLHHFRRNLAKKKWVYA